MSFIEAATAAGLIGPGPARLVDLLATNFGEQLNWEVKRTTASLGSIVPFVSISI